MSENGEFTAEMVRDNDSGMYYVEVRERETGSHVFRGPRRADLNAAAAAARSKLRKMVESVWGAEAEAVKGRGHS